jgi:hypothetical protein
MMLHLDGSSHEWIPDLPGLFYDLLVLLDDATNRIYEMVLVDEEDTLQCMTLLRDCVSKRGIFCSLYSDRVTFPPKTGQLQRRVSGCKSITRRLPWQRENDSQKSKSLPL